jgi:hypothetical protein
MKIMPASLALLLLLACDDMSKTTSPAQSSLSGDGNTPTLAPASLEAEVEFGSDHVGSPFPPAQHDNSFHAFDKIRPHVVHLKVGGSIEYEIYPCHQPAVYQPGTTPSDIDVSLTEPIGVTGCPPDRINDPNGRIALAPPQSLEEKDWTTPPGTFDQPGRYLVICTTFVHFQFAKMYSYVIVS